MHNDLSYNHQTVELDGQSFDGCAFAACRLIYAGGEPPVFTDCKFEACDWRFEGAAERTLSYLKVIWAAGAKAAVQAQIKDITVAPR